MVHGSVHREAGIVVAAYSNVIFSTESLNLTFATSLIPPLD